MRISFGLSAANRAELGASPISIAEARSMRRENRTIIHLLGKGATAPARGGAGNRRRQPRFQHGALCLFYKEPAPTRSTRIKYQISPAKSKLFSQTRARAASRRSSLSPCTNGGSAPLK